jgi:hypothetical protein
MQICASHCNKYKIYFTLGCDKILSLVSLQTFQLNFLPSSLGCTSVFYNFSSFRGLKNLAENDVQYAELWHNVIIYLHIYLRVILYFPVLFFVSCYCLSNVYFVVSISKSLTQNLLFLSLWSVTLYMCSHSPLLSLSWPGNLQTLFSSCSKFVYMRLVSNALCCIHHLFQHLNIADFAHRVYFCFPYDSLNEQWLFRCTS